MTTTTTLESSTASAKIDLARGGRLASLQVHGHELLVTDGASSIEWGCYPMAPWAGRTSNGRFAFDGVQYQLPENLGSHAIHGTVFNVPWEAEDPTSLRASLGRSWPFPGFVRQEITLDDQEIRLRLEVHATEAPMPAACGWHPWFRRSVGGAEVSVDFRPSYMLECDGEGIATSHKVTPSDGPWDDCFGDVTQPVRLRWPGVLLLDIETDCDYFVVYDEPEHAVCIEPQTAPPDTLNHDPVVVVPGQPLVATTTWRWAVERSSG